MTAEIEHGQSKDEGFIDGLPCRGERDVSWNGSPLRASMLRPHGATGGRLRK